MRVLVNEVTLKLGFMRFMEGEVILKHLFVRFVEDVVTVKHGFVRFVEGEVTPKPLFSLNYLDFTLSIAVHHYSLLIFYLP